MTSLTTLAQSIIPVDDEVRTLAEHHVSRLFKPVGSLGQLEQLACQLSAIYRTTHWDIGPKKIFVMGADHGVYEEDIAVSPREVTAIQAINTVKGVTGVAALAFANRVKVEMVDVGIDSDVLPGVTNFKVARGSGNIAKGAAMSAEVAEKLIVDCADYVSQCIDSEGLKAIGIGELGVGNTTAAAAMVCAITNQEPTEVVGLGANFPSDRIEHKIEVVRQALDINCPNPTDPIDIVAKVGGFDLAGMTGVILGGASKQVPVVLDGFLSYAAALLACKIAPNVWDYLIPSHRSAEKGASLALEELQLKPFIDMEMRLGEGSGAVLAMPFIDAAHAMYNRMAKMEDNGLELPKPL
ncbi:nicotinate-nucleotide--dimethylbenzimidazole phosphoribosyltransferase [Vibrio nitrifigilis]|uniref:Nicotinate-nucleotide--dimethylbenzimidazole phosphoribosyltransferase n=1 Tax=Vibrio nitrifigilis TaxID=2789781 RepID=A0ABS0GJI3_9VIBR|nr:nicotinate-nucleotide--dimethylbenzimidazole phosphoribosyltransferase [Vibrio nitrifigilis]MBF9002601.1 nicotinate-nucleotide--dimethylbenzimidazole phosphoribosyltransferase [Vibrio nitrifigilis]